ncbi:MAG: GH3 family domain-containing protein [Phycisphaerales bacterium]
MGGSSRSGSWTGLIGAGLMGMLWSRRRSLADRGWWTDHAGRVQDGVLRGLLRKAAGTEFGRECDFARLVELPGDERRRAYREAVPLADYEAFRARMARMREGGEPDVTWPGVVMDWAQTSGTTGGQKYIPVSSEMMSANRKAAFDIFCHAANYGRVDRSRSVSVPGVFGGRMLFLGGSTSVETNEHGIRTGDLSGLVTPLIRWPLTEVYAPGKDIALMEDWPAKIEAMARECAGQDIRFISGMASWSLVLFEKVLEVVRAGGGRASCLRDVWPNLSLFVHGGVRYPPFDPRVRQAWSGDATVDVPARLEVYPASEGFIAMQDTPGDPGLRLCMDHGVYYEFVPLEEVGSESASAFACDEVEPGVRYVVTMSTCAGLWRYVIGDVVVFDTVPVRGGRAEQIGPPRLRIVGRHRHFVNAFGENLIVEEIENAVVAARDEVGGLIGEFTAGPVYPTPRRRAGLELVVEWPGEVGERVSRFRAAFDAALRRMNVDYDTKRRGDMGMAMATVTTVPPGTFHDWMFSRGKLGGQNKCPRCANHREYVDGVRRRAGLPPDEQSVDANAAYAAP